jgi:hypothetical protein
MSNVSKGLLFYGYVEPEEGAWEAAHELYWDEYDRFNKLSGRLNVELDSIGYYLEALSCLHVTEPSFSVSWNDTKAIDPHTLATSITDEHRAALLELASELGIDLTGQTPNWYLAAYYG